MMLAEVYSRAVDLGGDLSTKAVGQILSNQLFLEQ
jgi:archaellum biogenesis protein FlaJ (TadC family)